MLIQYPMKRSLDEKPEDQVMAAVCHYDTWSHSTPSPPTNKEVVVLAPGDLRVYYKMSEYSDFNVSGVNIF